MARGGASPRSEAPKDEDGGGRLGRCVSGVDKAQKQRKRKECFAKRNERFRAAGRKSLRSLGSEIRRFREIVCFQGFNRFFVSPSRRMRAPDPKSLGSSRFGLGRRNLGIPALTSILQL